VSALVVIRVVSKKRKTHIIPHLLHFFSEDGITVYVLLRPPLHLDTKEAFSHWDWDEG